MAEWSKTYPDPNAATLNDVANHMDHIRKIAGVDRIGVSGEFDGFTGAVRCLEEVSKYPELFAELLRCCYSRDDLKKIGGQNVP
ncbi:MAG: hypothetical protein DVB33_04190 [Verrucomicrobia bacterium]|nr:MAG: hypothetical protein DVB33_04190 [Verrucomicrobiota bacterium]